MSSTQHQGIDNFCAKRKEPNNTTSALKTSEVLSYTLIDEDSAGMNYLITRNTVWEFRFSKLHFCLNSLILVLHT